MNTDRKTGCPDRKHQTIIKIIWNLKTYPLPTELPITCWPDFLVLSTVNEWRQHITTSNLLTVNKTSNLTCSVVGPVVTGFVLRYTFVLYPRYLILPSMVTGFLKPGSAINNHSVTTPISSLDGRIRWVSIDLPLLHLIRLN